MANLKPKKLDEKNDRRKRKPARKSWEAKVSAQSMSNMLSNLGPNQYPIDDPERMDHGHALLDEVQKMDIIEFATKVFGISFEKRPAQELALRVLYGLPIPEGVVEVWVEDPPIDGGLVLRPQKMTWMELYTMLTGNTEEFEPGVEKSQAVFCVGRRGGKSFVTSLAIDYEATRSKWRKYAREGEPLWAVITATREKQAQDILLDNCEKLFTNSGKNGKGLRFKWMIEDKTQSIMLLRNGYRVAAYPCSSNAALGVAAFAHAFDEMAYYGTTGPKSDVKIYEALTPAQATFSEVNPKTFILSSPAGEQGLFWDMVNAGSRVPGRLTIRAPSWVFNPPGAYDRRYTFLKQKYRENPDSFDMWYRGNFAAMVDALLNPEDVDRCALLAGDLPYDAKHFYGWGADQSGLTGNDRFSFSVGHKDRATGKIVVDCVRSWATKDGDEIVANIRGLAQKYHLLHGMIDRYASGWVTTALAKIPLIVEIRPSLAEVYNNLKTLLMADMVELPQRRPLTDALKRTQSYYSKTNTMCIGHERTSEGHGDEADSVATLAMAISKIRWLPRARTQDEEFAAAAAAHDEESYDPMTFGLTG